MFPRIVKFENGMFGIRKWLFIFYYKDITSSTNNFWWSKYSKYFKDCMGTKKSILDMWYYLYERPKKSENSKYNINEKIITKEELENMNE
jgi:hypothetical protein